MTTPINAQINDDSSATEFIKLPQDQYRHVDSSGPAQFEWWWHVGTLRCGDRMFGFEINAAGFAPADRAKSKFLLAYIMLTDVKNKKHYQVLKNFDWNDNWATTDSTQPWKVNVGLPDQLGSIEMFSDQSAQMGMHVLAKFKDATLNSTISFDLRLKPKLPPMLVFGTGRSPLPVNPDGATSLSKYNYYYSFPKLNTTGTVKIDGEVFEVSGLTWMDHEYGAWDQNKKVTWILQDITLNDGVCISVFAMINGKITPDLSIPASYTILGLDGSSQFHYSDARVTPIKSSEWKGPSGVTYYPTVKVEIPTLKANLLITSLVAGQEFWNLTLPDLPVYEGVAKAEGTYLGVPVSCTAWNEQCLK